MSSSSMTKTDTIDTLIDRLNELQFEQTETIRRIAELRKEEECQQTLKTESEEVSLDNEPDQDQAQEQDDDQEHGRQKEQDHEQNHGQDHGEQNTARFLLNFEIDLIASLHRHYT